MEEREIEYFERRAEDVVGEVLRLVDYNGTFTPRQKKLVARFVRMGFWGGVDAEVSFGVDWAEKK